jgi:hypothetical protein
MGTSLAGVSKQDFVAIAKVFCKHNVSSAAAEDIASYFGQKNPGFQRDRFLAATRKC